MFLTSKKKSTGGNCLYSFFVVILATFASLLRWRSSSRKIYASQLPGHFPIKVQNLPCQMFKKIQKDLCGSNVISTIYVFRCFGLRAQLLDYERSDFQTTFFRGLKTLYEAMMRVVAHYHFTPVLMLRFSDLI